MAFDNESGHSFNPVTPQVPLASPFDNQAFGLSGALGEPGRSFQATTPFTPTIVGDVPAAFPLEFPVVILYLNTLQSYTASCNAGYSGTPVTVNIAPGTYISKVSQAAANAAALAAATAAANASIVCTLIPTVGSSFVSGTGNITYRGYIDPRYMRTNVEFGTRTASAAVVPYSAGNTYENFRRVFSGAKFYRSLQNGNVGNTPATSPTFWTECESPVYWLSQTLGNQRHICFWAGSVNCGAATYSQRTQDNDFNGSSSVDHTTGVETWNGSITRYADSAIDLGSGSCPSRNTIGPTTDTSQLNTLNGMAPAGNAVLAAVTNSQVLRGDTPGCQAGGTETRFNSAIRNLATGELAENYFTMSGAGAATINGTWNDNGWTNTGATVSILTANCSNLIIGRSYRVDIVYSVTGGPTPATNSTTFTAGGLTNSFSVTTPFGAAAQTTSISSLTITLLP